MIALRLGASRRRLPLPRFALGRALPCILALMAYVAGLGAIGVMALGDGLRAAQASVAGRLTLTVPAEATAARLQTILATVRQTAGIAAVHELTPAEVGALLRPWLGPAAPLGELPIPRVVDAKIDPAATVDLATLRRHLAALDPDARLDDHQASFDALRRAVRRARWVCLGAAAIALLLVAPAALEASRSELTVQQATIELVHQLGAADGDITRHLAAGALAAGLLGGAIGGIAVIATVAVLGGAVSVLMPAGPAAAIGLGDWRVWATVVGIALAVGVIAAAGAQAMARRRLAEMP